MARKELTLTIDMPGRDVNKSFFIREMSATKAERWATRALLALLKSGIEIPEDIAQAGLAGVAAMGLRAFGGIDFSDAEPLLAEMMTCVQIIPDASRPMVKRALVEDDIEEVTTLLRLREEVLSLHLNFSIAAFRLKLTAANQTAAESSLNTETSQKQWVQ
jgi:hypothetical protein